MELSLDYIEQVLHIPQFTTILTNLFQKVITIKSAKKESGISWTSKDSTIWGFFISSTT